MRVLIACEFSGIVRQAFSALGHDAWSCDLLPTEQPGQHIQGNVLGLLKQNWDLVIAHPPCTYLCVSGQHWNGRVEGRQAKTESALMFALAFMDCAPKVCVENPIGIISTRFRRPDQIVQPYHFGEDASKATCLWLKNLPRLTSTKYVAPRIANGKPRWSNQTDSGQNKLAPSDTRWMERSRTYPGMAAAMAEQWGKQIAFKLEAA